ncbi:hypothetical protein F0562_023630 [Nyssa sinensis]|uniref:Uncharacterized protein n=1 Tax=Nyssa sinensis TaxID=561372 RepID=A0A5J5BHS7_9ASTE|nr:hypothetical protein F0562_023630 [Nyssa sinensis]
MSAQVRFIQRKAYKQTTWTLDFFKTDSGYLYLSSIMEMERVTEFPHTHMDRRPRKRPRLGWDVVPQAPKIRSTAKWVKAPLVRS